MSPRKKKRKGQPKCLSSPDVQYVGATFTILNAISKMEGLGTSELSTFQRTLKRKRNRGEKFVSKQEIELFEEVSAAPLPRNCFISFGKLYSL